MLFNSYRRRDKSIFEQDPNLECGLFLYVKPPAPPTRSMASHFCHSSVGPALRRGNVGMHGGVPDEAEAGWRGVMKLRDWGGSGRKDAVGGGSVTRSFLLTVGAGRGERRIRLDSALSLPGCQSGRPNG